MSDKRAREIDKWYIFPDNLNPPRFRGYITRDDVSQVRGAFPVGQNMMFNDGMIPTIRPGSIRIGSQKSGTTSIKRAWRFERRDGQQIEMRAYGTKVDFFIANEMTEYSDLLSGLTANKEFCFAVISKSSIVPSYVYFCNGVEDWYKWSGAFAKYQSDDASSVITVDELLGKAAYLQGRFLSIVTLANFLSVSDGSFRITIDGTGYNVDALDFTSDTTLAEVAATMQVGLRTATSSLETVTYDSDKNAFIITTIDSNSSAITVATTSTGTVGTDISGEGLAYASLSENRASAFDREVYNFTVEGSIVINGEIIQYTGISGYTFTGCAAVPTAPTVDDILVQAPENVMLSSFKGSVGMAHGGRIHARLETKKSVSNYSKLDDPDDWTTGSNDGDGGAKEIEQGGPITAYGNDEKSLYIFKKRKIKILEFTQTGTRVDVPFYADLKPADDRSTTTGAIGQKSTFHSPNGIIFVTEDKELIHLTREKDIDYPQLLSISDPISPTFKAGVHDEAAGIVYKSKVYYAFKRDSNSNYNDVVIVYDLIRKIWHAPYIGWSVGDWTIIENKLRWHSSITPNTFELQSDLLDNSSAYTTILRTHSEDFGEPTLQKTIDSIALELKLSDNFEGTITVLYDDDGFSGQTEIDISAEEDIGHILKKDEYTMFGSSPFGSRRFGSNEDLAGLDKYIYIIPLKANIQFYNVSIQISSDKQNVNYELIRYAYHEHQLFLLPAEKFIKNII